MKRIDVTEKSKCDCGELWRYDSVWVAESPEETRVLERDAETVNMLREATKPRERK